MKVQDCSIPGLKLVQLDAFSDERGFFCERFHAEKFAAAGLPSQFVQDNLSFSAPGVLRGLHYQVSPAQGKLVGIIRGRVWDVAVDIRPESPHFGKYYGVELSGDNHRLLWMPAGFAHGFCVLGDEPSYMLYKLDGVYNPKTEGGIRFDDEALAIDWPVKNPIISDRDRAQATWREYAEKPPAWSLCDAL